MILIHKLTTIMRAAKDFVDLSVLKIAVSGAGETVLSQNLTELDGLIEITFPIPTNAAGKDGITVYRRHGDSPAEALAKDYPSSPGGEYFTVSGGYISKWYKSSVKEMADRGIINGISDTRFADGQGVTRAQHYSCERQVHIKSRN